MAAFVSGIVTDDATGLPIEGAIVKILVVESVTDENGWYLVRVGEGERIVYVSAPGYENMEIGPITLVEGNNELNIALTPVVGVNALILLGGVLLFGGTLYFIMQK